MSVGGFFDYADTPGYEGFGELIPDKTFVKVKMAIRPGDYASPDPADGMIMKASTSSDVYYLDTELTVILGKYTKRKLWHSFTVSGGKVSDKGESLGWNISKSMFRSIIDSAMGLNPDDNSEQARAMRRINGFRAFNGIEFAARIDIRPGEKKADGSGVYPDKNIIGDVLTSKDPQYLAVMRGEEIAHAATATPVAGAAPASVWAGAPPVSGVATAGSPWGPPAPNGAAPAAQQPMQHAAAAAPPPAQPPAASPAPPPAANVPVWLQPKQP
jgi:hypothetical protein